MLKRNQVLRVGLLCLSAALAPMANAAESPRKLTCAAFDIYQCEKAYDCARVPSESINFPHFFIADLAEKSLTGKRPDGSNFRTAIQQQANENAVLVLQGVEAARAWSMTVNADNGDLSIAVAAPGIGFIGVGACLVE